MRAILSTLFMVLSVGWSGVVFAQNAGWSPNIHIAADKDWCFGTGSTLHVGDFNGGGRDDLLCLNSVSGRRGIDFATINHDGFYGTNWDSLNQAEADQDWCFGAGHTLYVGDFDGNGRDDLLCHNSITGARRIDFADTGRNGFYGSNWFSGNHAEADKDWCFGAGRTLHVGDFDGNERDDLLCHNSRSGRVRIDHANRAGHFFGTNASSVESEWCRNPLDRLYVGNFDADNRADLLCHNQTQGWRSLRYANSRGDFLSVCSDSSTQGDGTLRPIGVHFVVLSDPNHPTVANRATRMPTATTTHTHPLNGSVINQAADPTAYFRAEVDLINAYIYDTDGNNVCDETDCMQFEYSSHTFYDEASNSSCEALLNLADPDEEKWASDCDDGLEGTDTCGEGVIARETWDHAFRQAINDCTTKDTRIWKPGVINIYIVDRCEWDHTLGEINNNSCRAGMSHGRGDKFYVMADYIRLLRGPSTGDRGNARGVEQHELGHVFGIHHVFDGWVTDTNPMHKEPWKDGSSADYCNNPAPNCGATAPGVLPDREEGFSTSTEPYEGPNKCSNVNQLEKMVRSARAMQAQWSCN